LTCVAGNTTLSNVLLNVQRVCEACDLKTEIYAGSARGFVQAPQDASFYHGVDGLGDASCDDENSQAFNPILGEAAAAALIRICKAGMRVAPYAASAFGLRKQIERWTLALEAKHAEFAQAITAHAANKAVELQKVIHQYRAFIAHCEKLCFEFVGPNFNQSESDVEPTVEVLALGPLTNLALATRLDECFPFTVRSLVVMGGSEKRGNIFGTFNAEFNFHHDPESAYVVLDAFPVCTLVTFELTLSHEVAWDIEQQWCEGSSKKCKFRQKITRYSVNRGKARSHPGYCSCDLIAALVMIDPVKVVRGCESHHVSVELAGSARGACLIDWSQSVLMPKPANVHLITQVDVATYAALARKAFTS
jgi:inosine-uridine nucleoside N-ribohydrolase